MNGALRPGDRIKQDLVAKQFGVSRSPVREAFLELAAEGFVELERDVGARVASLEPETLAQLYVAREAVEPLIIAEATRMMTPEVLEQAHSVNVEAEERHNAGDLHGYIDRDRDMHFLLLRASGLQILCDLATGLWDRTHRYRLAVSQQKNLDHAFYEHRLLLDAIERGAADDAADIYRIHTRRTRVTLLDRLEHPTGEPFTHSEEQP
jgi:DNA-binding GntR family transcriptional regulator